MSPHGERHWPCDRSPKSQSAKAANFYTKWLHSGQVDAGVQEWAEKTLQCSQTRPPGGIKGVQRCSCKCNTIFNNCGCFCFFQFLIFHFMVNKCVYELRLNIQSFHKYLCHICAFCLTKEVELNKNRLPSSLSTTVCDAWIWIWWIWGQWVWHSQQLFIGK